MSMGVMLEEFRKVPAGVTTTVIGAGLVSAIIWAWNKREWIGHILSQGPTWHEALAWCLVAVLLLVCFALATGRLRRVEQIPAEYTSDPEPPMLVEDLRPVRTSLTPNDGEKGSVTIRHAGPPCSYRVEGQIVKVFDGSNPWAAPFSCELQVRGLDGDRNPTMEDGSWANVILGQVMDTDEGRLLAVRKGGFGDHVVLHSVGALVELRVDAQSSKSVVKTTRRFAVALEGFDRVRVIGEPPRPIDAPSDHSRH
jgi:hypothetical protein